MKKIIALTSIVAALTGCASQNMQQHIELVQGPSIRTVVGPYDEAKACMAKIPQAKQIVIGIGDIVDATGHINMAEGGSGAFLPINLTKMMESSFGSMGVQLVDLSRNFRTSVDWYTGLGMMQGSGIARPNFVVGGTISALDFLDGNVMEVQIAGVGPKSRMHNAVARGDFSISTFPSVTTPGGKIVALSKLEKQFTAYENEFGVATFVGGGTGARFASFRVGKGEREPMQYATGYIMDYAAVELAASLLMKTDASQKDVAACHDMLTKAEEGK